MKKDDHIMIPPGGPIKFGNLEVQYRLDGKPLFYDDDGNPVKKIRTNLKTGKWEKLE